MNYWMIRNFHGLSWECGHVPYEDYKRYINHVLKRVSCIYVKRLEKKIWLEHILEKPIIIINLNDIYCPSLKKLRTCGSLEPHHCIKNYNYVYENVLQLHEWIKNIHYKLNVSSSLCVPSPIDSCDPMVPLHTNSSPTSLLKILWRY